MYLFVIAVFFLAGVDVLHAEMPHRPSTLEADSSLRVMTFNIRFDNPNDGPDAWPHRKDRAASVIRFHGADLVGVQEALKHQLDDLQERLPAYAWVGVGRADGREGGEYSAIFYRQDRFELLDHDTFWLSETPEVPGSKSWDAAIERIVTWAHFRDRRTGEVFYHFNTHFDHIGERARTESAKLIRQRIAAVAGDAPVVLTGDFNAVDSSMPYQILTGTTPLDGAPSVTLRDAMRISEHGHHGPTTTWNGFTAIEPDRRIDYIFVNDRVDVRQHGILPDTWDGRFPSDHLPVVADVTIR